jgi:predicted nucleic acid-binding protein
MSAAMQWGKARYLDTSALVKLLVDEGNHQRLRAFFENNTSFATTSLCLAEALGVIKGKWTHGRLTDDQYFAATRRLISDAWGERIEVEDSVDLFTPDAQTAVEDLARRHRLDLSDALQIQTIRYGRYSRLGPNSASILITADRNLARAAQEEGIRVWICIDNDPPDWA